jgi:hypothetical protein
MPYSKDWIAYINAWADQKPLKSTDGPFVFKTTMKYSATGITGDVKEITRTFDASGTVLDLPDTATKAFIDIGLTNGVLPASDSISAVRTPLSSDLAVLPVPTRDISPPVPTSTLALPTVTSSSGTDGSTTTVQSIPTPVATSKPRVKPTVQPDLAPTRRSARILERGYGYRKPASIIYCRLKCPMNVAFATGSLTWHEAAKSNNAAEAKEAALKKLRTLTNLKSWRYLHSVSDKTPSVHNKITVPTLLLKPKYHGTILVESTICLSCTCTVRSA